METTQPSQHDLLKEILTTLQSVQADYRELSTVVRDLWGRLNVVTEHQSSHQSLTGSDQGARGLQHASEKPKEQPTRPSPAMNPTASPSLLSLDGPRSFLPNGASASPQRNLPPGVSSRIILTTYPGQSGIDPLVMNWGHPDPPQRGPVVVSRSQSTIRRRNGTPVFTYGAYGSTPERL